MTDLALILALLLAYGFGWYQRDIDEKVQDLLKRMDTRPVPPAVASSNPEFVNQNQAGHTESLIVEPKSPQLVDWEEKQELDRLNKTVKVKPR